MAITNTADLFEKAITVTTVEIESLGGESVFIRQLSQGETEELAKGFTSSKDPSFDAIKEKTAMTVVFGLCDENGNRLFKKSEVSKVNAGLSAQVCQEIAEKIRQHSSLGATEATVEAEKNA